MAENGTVIAPLVGTRNDSLLPHSSAAEMHALTRTTSRRQPLLVALLAGAIAAGSALPAEAQYFGRNKVQYEPFDFRVLRTPHFSIHFYPAESLATADAARMAERWYDRQSRLLNHAFERKPLIFYANHPDFQQTNVIGGFISQGTGGVTESARNRVVMPFTGVYAENDHVLGHELVHVFQYDIAAQPNAGGLSGMGQLPLWLIEGMAEYLSLGRDDPNTAMWLRDAALRNDLPTIRQLTTDSRYFPYRYGQALWAYIGGRWGDATISRLYRSAIAVGWEPSIVRLLGVNSDSLTAQWLGAIRASYLPLIEGRQAPGDIGERVLERQGREGEMDLSPALSPDGRHVAFFTRRGLFSIDLYVAETATGRVVKKLTGPNTDSHFDAISFINSSGAWSPDGNRFAFVIQREGDNEISIYDVESGRVSGGVKVRTVGEITSLSWSSNGQIAFSGTSGGLSDLYIYDVEAERVRRMTSDRYADLQPSWSPDGRTIAFATDRGPGTDFEQLTYAPTRIALMDAETGVIRLLPLFEGPKHINPQWAPDGQSLYFISDRHGFSDIYRLSIPDNSIHQVTRLATGVSGISTLSPALSVARESGLLAFTVFHRGGHSLFRLPADQAGGEPVSPDEGTLIAGILPPAAVRDAYVDALLEDPVTGLPDTAFRGIRDYRSTLSLEYLGSPGVGVGVGPAGIGAGGGITGYFTDLLRDRVVGASIFGGGDFKDIGGELFYLNQRRRWNWMASAAHIPYLTGGVFVGDTTVDIGGGEQVQAQVIEQVLQRTFVDQGSTGLQYPFSQTRRIEFAATYTHLGFSTDVERIVAIGNQVVGRTRGGRESPPGVDYYQGSAAYVGDYSVFGFTSPVAGGRYRFEVAPTFGDVTFQTALADYRRYVFLRPVTIAFRGMHYARYGKDAESNRLNPLYLGQEAFIRGYNVESIQESECTRIAAGDQSCPEFDRLIGSRLAIANLELRIPLLGTREFGLIDFPYLPVEIAPFVDAGAAWTSDASVDWRFDRESSARIPVVSAGVTARINLFGYAVGEVYWVHPFQRPERGSHFGFHLAPGF